MAPGACSPRFCRVAGPQSAPCPPPRSSPPLWRPAHASRQLIHQARLAEVPAEMRSHRNDFAEASRPFPPFRQSCRQSETADDCRSRFGSVDFVSSAVRFSCASVALLQSRPEVDDPCAAPSCVSAACLQSTFERNPRRTSECRSAAQSDLITGMQREQMRDVSVPRVGLIVIFEPFHAVVRACRSASLGKRSRAADNSARKSSDHSSSRSLASITRVKQRVRDLGVHRRPHAKLAMVPSGATITILR